MRNELETKMVSEIETLTTNMNRLDTAISAAETFLNCTFEYVGDTSFKYNDNLNKYSYEVYLQNYNMPTAELCANVYMTLDEPDDEYGDSRIIASLSINSDGYKSETMNDIPTDIRETVFNLFLAIENTI